MQSIQNAAKPSQPESSEEPSTPAEPQHDHFLVLRDITIPLDATILRNQLNIPVLENDYPPADQDGMAIIDCGREPNLKWATTVIKVGVCEKPKRIKVHYNIGKTEDPEFSIVEAIREVSDSYVEAE